MLPVKADQTTEQRQQLVESSVRQLRALSKTRLQAYCDKSGREIVWSLPAPASV
jgi:hypothetical protein